METVLDQPITARKRRLSGTPLAKAKNTTRTIAVEITTENVTTGKLFSEFRGQAGAKKVESKALEAATKAANDAYETIFYKDKEFQAYLEERKTKQPKAAKAGA